MKWNVFVGDFNHGVIRTHNVFDHDGVMFDLCKAARKYKDDQCEEFIEAMRRSLMYYYWSKCEWEVVIDHWPHSDRRKPRTVDVWQQIDLNWGAFCDYVWSHRAELRRREKKNGAQYD